MMWFLHTTTTTTSVSNANIHSISYFLDRGSFTTTQYVKLTAYLRNRRLDREAQKNVTPDGPSRYRPLSARSSHSTASSNAVILRALLLPTHYTQQYHYALKQPAIISFGAVAPLAITSYINRLPRNGMLHIVFMSKIQPRGKKKLDFFVRKTWTPARG